MIGAGSSLCTTDPVILSLFRTNVNADSGKDEDPRTKYCLEQSMPSFVIAVLHCSIKMHCNGSVGACVILEVHSAFSVFQGRITCLLTIASLSGKLLRVLCVYRFSNLFFGAVTAQGGVLHGQRDDFGVLWFISVQSLRLDIEYNNSRLNIFPS